MSIELGPRIAELRQQKGWTQRALANEAQVSQALVSMIEAGLRPDPSITIVARLANAFGVTIDDLIKPHMAQQREVAVTGAAA